MIKVKYQGLRPTPNGYAYLACDLSKTQETQHGIKTVAPNTVEVVGRDTVHVFEIVVAYFQQR